MNKYLLGLIVVIILYIVYSYFFADHTSANLVGMHNAKSEVRVEATSLPGNSASADFTFSVWVYINDWNYRYGYTKPVFYRGDKKGAKTPQVNFGSNTNELDINVLCYPTTGKKTDPGTPSHCKVSNIPIQKWTHILFTTNGNTLDTYLDGKLVRTCVLPGVPKMDKTKPIFLTPDEGFSGYTSKFRFYARTLNPREVYDIYREGYSDNPLGALLGKYKMKVAFLRGSEEMNSFTV
jgi:hypothetical protein